MIKDLTKKLNKICNLPRPTRDEVSKILKECYKQGFKDREKYDKNFYSIKTYKKLKD